MASFRKLKGIVFVNQSLSEGGGENFTRELLSWFASQGVKVKAYTTSNPFAKKLRRDAIKTKKIPIVIDIIGDWKGFLKGLIFFIPGIFYYAKLVIQNRDEGVFFLSGYIEKVLVTPWAKLLNIPIVWVEHGPLSPVLSISFGIPGVLYRFVARYPDYVIFPSRFSMESNLKISGIDKGKMIVVNDGIRPLKKYPGRLMPNTVFCVSRLEEGKGQDILIKAWKNVVKVFPDAKLYIIGTGDFRFKLDKIISELDLQRNVVLTGWVKDLAHKISSVELGAFPSVWSLEGFGVVLLEAMSLGKPIVCFDHGPYPEVVDENCALVVKQRDPESLSDAIVKVFSDQNLARKLGEQGKRKFEQLFTIEKCGLGYAKVFEKAIDDRKLFKNTSRISIYTHDLFNKGLRVFVKDRIKKRKIGRRFYYFFKKPYVNIFGNKLYINKMDTVVSENLLEKGVWEPQMTNLLKKYLFKTKTFADIGANIGYYSLIAGQILKNKGKVFAFEPVSTNFDLMKKTVAESGFGNITVEKLALGDREGDGSIYLNDENFGDQRLWGKETCKKEKIKLTTLDKYFLDKKTKPDLIKIDVQGYELKVFKGAKGLLKERRIKVILSELWPDGLECAGDSWEKYIIYLEKHGFKIYEVCDSGETEPFTGKIIEEEYARNRNFTTNILAVLKK